MKITPINRARCSQYVTKFSPVKNLKSAAGYRDKNWNYIYNDLKAKPLKELSEKEAPLLGFAIGLLSPIPLGCVAGFLIGKLVQTGLKFTKKTK